MFPGDSTTTILDHSFSTYSFREKLIKRYRSYESPSPIEFSGASISARFAAEGNAPGKSPSSVDADPASILLDSTSDTLKASRSELVFV